VAAASQPFLSVFSVPGAFKRECKGMSQESSSGAGTCPYPDCRASVNLGKKFCKTCGRPILGVMASPTPAAKEPTAPFAEPVAAMVPQSIADSPESQDQEPNIAPPSSPPEIQEPPLPPDTAVVPPQPMPAPANRGPGNARMLVVVGGLGLVLIAALGYWLMRPKAVVQVAALQTQEGNAPPVSPTVPSALPPPETASISTAKERGNDPQPQQDDSLRRERDRLAAERVRLEQVQQQAREQEQRHQQDLAQRQQEAEAQQRTLAELKAKQEEQQRQIDEGRRKLAEDQAQREREAQARRIAPPAVPAPFSPPAPVYRGPSSGELVWEGMIKGTELITIENGQASSGTVTGALPGVAVLIQPTDTKKVSIASTPGPRNQYSRVVFRVAGNGNTRVTLKWSLP